MIGPVHTAALPDAQGAQTCSQCGMKLAVIPFEFATGAAVAQPEPGQPLRQLTEPQTCTCAETAR